MDIIVKVCMVILTIAVVALVAMVIMVLQDVRKTRIKLVDFLEKMERELIPLITEVTHISEDLKEVTFTARSQFEKIESTTEFISKNVQDIIERWITTLTVVNNALAEPVENIAVFLKGFAKGIKYFFGDGRNSEHHR